MTTKMKCICGYEGEGARIFVGKELTTDFEQYGIYATGRAANCDGDLVKLYACPKCGTVKVDFDDNPLADHPQEG
ncbi:MAG: hypothetical protein LBK83_15795 [Treponema sp.]|jgi:hypothetical protein|nr:hypothetical protein [Treponema sp.]